MDDITIEDVAALIEAFTEEDWRRKHNGGGMDVLLGGCKEIQATRLFQQAHARQVGRDALLLEDVAAAVRRLH